MQSKAKTKFQTKTLDIIFIAMFAALVTICSQIQIPFGPVPFTLQTLAVFITGSVLGFKRGTASILLYVLMGFIGLPVFSGFKGGAGALIQPTGGYIIGFIFTALIIGIMTDLLGKKLWVLAASMSIGMAVCYLFGTIWFTIISKTDFLSALSVCVVPFLLADAVKIATATILVNRINKFIKL